MTDAVIRIKGRNEIGPAVRSAERDLKKLAQTGELVGKFLRGGGIVLAIRAFEQLAENAQEAAEKMGDKGTARSLKLLNAEIDKLKSKGTNLIGKVLGTFATAAFGTGQEKALADVQLRIRQIQDQLKGTSRFGRGPINEDSLKNQLKILQEMEKELSDFGEEGPTKNKGRGGGGSAILIDEDDVARMEKEAADAARKAAQAAADAWDETLRQAARKGSLGTLAPSSEDMGAFKEAVAQMSDDVEQDLEDLANPVKEVTEKWTVYAEQAARNMQDALAEFLFDPFEDGLQGMLKGFIDVLRQMIAQAAASSIFEGIAGSFTGAVGKFLFGRASGGPVAAGHPYMVGEKGRELFVPSTSGTIVPNNEIGGGSAFTYHIDARGADAARIMATLPAVLRQAQQDTISRIRDLQKRGRI